MSANHHFVPQFYLRNFSNNGSSIATHLLNSELFVANASIKGQCQKKDFYGADQSREKALAAFEGLWAAAFRELIQLPTWHSFDPVHVNTLMFVAAQNGRSMASKIFAESLGPRMAEEFFSPERVPGDVDLGDLIFSRQSGESESAVQFMLDMNIGLWPLLADLQMVLVTASEPRYITSDNPLVMMNSALSWRTTAGNAGYQSPGLQVILPISPAVCLILFDRRVYGVGRRNPKVVAATDDDIEQLNVLQALNSLRCLYFNDTVLSAKDIRNVTARAAKCRVEPENRTVTRAVPSVATSDRDSKIVQFFNSNFNGDVDFSFLKTRKDSARLLHAVSEKHITIRHPELFAMHEEFRRENPGLRDNGKAFITYLSKHSNVLCEIRNGKLGYRGDVFERVLAAARSRSGGKAWSLTATSKATK